jgi:dihydrofolate synthase/folylpolyglutamate synthase
LLDLAVPDTTLPSADRPSSAERSDRLLAALGSPHLALPVIHVGGTNGKGSTVALLESVCRHAGLRTGLFTSPHLYRPGERIRLDGRPMPTDDLVGLMEQEVLPAAATIGLFPTPFEVYTATAMVAFARRGVDVAIVEVGLGGRDDATNVFLEPLATVITTIGMDHMQQLGHTLPEIARAKAGIIRPGSPLITGAHGVALEAIGARAAELGVAVTPVVPGAELGWSDSGQRLQFAGAISGELDGAYDLPLLGSHQLLNAAMALQTLEQVRERLPIPVDAVRRGVAAGRWPGRMELADALEVRWLLDGAHNGDGAAALKACLQRHFPGFALGLVFGALADKPWQDMVAQLRGVAAHLWLTPVPNSRSASPATLAAGEWDMPVALTASYPEALFQAWRWAAPRREPTLLVVAGSLSLVGACREYLNLD